MAGKGSNVGNVYVTVVPTMRGFAREMNRQLSGVDVTQTGRKMGERMGGSMATALSDKLVRSGSAISKLGSSMADLGGKLTQGVTLPLATATAGVGAFALSTASAAETTEMSFTTMLGSAEAAERMMSRLADFAAKTPFELSGLQTATRQLLAYGFTAEDVIPMLTAVGDATAALGTGQAGIEAVTRALGQMQAKGKVQAEEMLQLTEQGIPAWQMLADTLGTDVAGAQEKVTAGAVDSATAIDALVSGMEARYGGLMEKQSQTLAGLASNLVDSLTQPLMELRESDAYAELKDSFSEVVDAAGPFVESLLPHMERGLESVSDVLSAAADAMEGFSDMSESAQGDLIGLVAKAALAGPALTVAGRGLQALGTGIGGVGKVVGGASSLIGGLQAKLLDFATAPGRAATPLTKLVGVMGQFPGATALAAAGIAIVGSGIASFVSCATEGEREARVQAEALEVLGRAAETSADSIEAASDSPRMLGAEISSLGDEIQENWQSITDLGSQFDELNRNTSANISQLQDARQAVADYAGQTDLSAQRLGSLRAAVEVLNDQCGTSYEVVKDSGGAYQVMADGATVAKESIYELIDAQIQQAKIDAASDKLKSIYSEQAEQAEEYARALAQVSDAEKAYDEALSKYGKVGSNYAKQDLDEAKSNLAEVESQMEETGAAAERLETQIGNAAAGGTQSFADLVDGSGALAAFFEETGGDAADFAADLEASGVSLSTFSGLTDAQLAQVAAQWDGTAKSVTEALSDMGVAVDGYNAVPLLGKDAAVTVDSMQLSDAQGRAVVWNGTDLVWKDTGVSVGDTELIDSQNRVWVWNGTDLIPKSTTAQATGNAVTGVAQRAVDNLVRSIAGMHDKSVTLTVTNRTINQTENRVYSGTIPKYAARGGIRTHADGGVRMHAVGAIATKAVPLDIVGEAGAEAIVPLTNRRYSQPFADIIAEGVAERSGGAAEVVAAIAALRDEIRGMGVYLDSGRLVGGISRDMNRSLGRMQRRGALSR